MPTDIYSQHAAAFNRVSAFVVLKDGKRVATVALKLPTDGAGRLYAYVQWIGNAMTRGLAGGYGYDKRSAAVADAGRKFMGAEKRAESNIGAAPRPDRDALKYSFFEACQRDDGGNWVRSLEDSSFTVLQAV